MTFLTAQRGLFAGPAPIVSKDLYSEVLAGSAVRDREAVRLAPGTKVSGNTYFGRFPASYWQRWTDVAQVEFRVIASGAGRISIRASDSAGDARTVATVVVDAANNERVRLVARVDRYVDGGALWLEASTDSAELVLEAGCWSVTKCEPVRPTVVVMCTYNRADDCLRTLDALHLASCDQSQDWPLSTTDKRMRDAATLLRFQ